jgi:hypothetical protein
MKRWTAPLATGMVVLYAALAVGIANCLFLDSGQSTSHHHHHNPSHLAHSALCAWACQSNPTVAVPLAMPLVAVSTVVTRRRQIDSILSTTIVVSEFPSRGPPR